MWDVAKRLKLWSLQPSQELPTSIKIKVTIWYTGMFYSWPTVNCAFASINKKNDKNDKNYKIALQIKNASTIDFDAKSTRTIKYNRKNNSHFRFGNEYFFYSQSISTPSLCVFLYLFLYFYVLLLQIIIFHYQWAM